MKTNKSQAAIQGLAFASQLLPAIIGLGSFMLLVRVTKPEILGEYIVYTTAVILFEMIKSGGLQSALVMRASTDDQHQQKTIIGSAYWLGGLISLSISVILIILFFSGIFSQNAGIQIFCGWYAVLGLVTLPLHIAEAEAVAKQDLKFLLLLRITQSTNALIIAFYAFLKEGSLEEFATVHLGFNICLLVFVLIFKKTNPFNIKFKTMTEVKSLFNLIKYTLATLATTNVLKSADTFLIGSLMGSASVAKYAIPLKLTELFEIPLRSLSTTAFPQLAAKHNEKDYSAFKKTLVQYLSWSYLLYIPGLLFAFILAPYLVLIIGGKQYADTTPIFRVFILFGLLLPINRMTGICLDALQLPNKNFLKVFIMAIVNIVADLLALYLTHNLVWVAFASVINAIIGATLGWWMLDKTGLLEKHNILIEIIDYCKEFIGKMTNKLTQKQ
ncbi:oligosaccharide flippase family protein [Arcicella sp. LKC2W]|uniref:oligosaccharide flippase family protein n=1 Tax=Arcicella sp. LKC2W TaxID=2984198 RepID=UPI002B2133CA|nr:oligosaccharide flippase family protein [Arcicella sp. LKC2W]MEA5460787.1 oligosaccharide flippase family protein [Arcicella sp. LKC2W]